MGTFAYIARDTSGQRVTGRLAGANERAVLAELASRSLAPIEVAEVRDARRRRRVPARRLAAMYKQLADLLRAGVPLLRALRLLGRSKSHPVLGTVMSEVAEAISEGERLADALAERKEIFPSIHVAMIRAGEQGGFLEQVLARLGTFLEHQAEMRSRIIGSLIYPAMLMIVAVGVITAALVFLVPQFKPMFAKLELGWPTKLLLGVSDLLTAHGWLVLIAFILAGFAVRQVFRNEDVRTQLAVWQLKIPKVGPLVRSLSVARFTRILGTLLDNGIPMLTAMQIARDAAGHPVMSKAIDEAIEAVRAGESLAKPLADSGMFDDDVIEMISVGESANNLPEVLVTIAETIESRVDRMLNIMIRLFEPVMLLAMAGVVMFIFVALALPMMKMSTALR